jgi:hypothetical protein
MTAPHSRCKEIIRKTIRRLLAAAVLLPAAFPFSASHADSLPGACRGWIDPASMGDRHYDLSDVEAHYFATLIKPGTAAGVRIRIDGSFPAARNFSITAYKGPGPLVDDITDYQIQPSPGSQSAFLDKVHIDPAVSAGGHYSVYVEFTAKPDNPAPNTLYLDPAKLNGLFSQIVYRIYLPDGGVANGGVALPKLTVETPQGDVAPPYYSYCGLWGPATAQLSLPFEVLLTQSGLFSIFPSGKPNFYVYRTLPGNYLEALNGDIGYLYSYIRSSQGDLAVIRGKAPTYTTQPGVEPRVRHWSICENSTGALTYDCVEDHSAAIDAGGYYNIVISPPGKKPATATHDYGFDWISYGTNPVPPEGVIIYRQQLAAPDFAEAISNIPQGGSASRAMGDYYPHITYCSSDVFAQHTAAKDSPESVFAACQAGR